MRRSFREFGQFARVVCGGARSARDHMADLSIWQWLAIAVVASVVLNPWIAYKKTRPMWLWFALGVLFNPIALVILLFLPSLPRPPYRPPAAPGEMRMTE